VIDTYPKALRVINSCILPGQLHTASRFVGRATSRGHLKPIEGEVLQELCLARERMMLETKTGIKRE